MGRLWDLLIWGCWHTWKEDKRLQVTSTETSDYVGEAVFCTCTKCGVPKRFDLY